MKIYLASAARPKAKKLLLLGVLLVQVSMGVLFEGDVVKKLPELHTLRHDTSIQDQVKARIRGGSVDIFVKKELNGPMSLY